MDTRGIQSRLPGVRRSGVRLWALLLVCLAVVAPSPAGARAGTMEDNRGAAPAAAQAPGPDDGVQVAGTSRPAGEETKPLLALDSDPELEVGPGVDWATGPAAADIRLPPLDVEALRTEDEVLLREKNLQRIGVRRSLPGAVAVDGTQSAQGRWVEAVSGGRIWTLTLESPGAEAIRVHLEELSLPGGVQLWIYDTDDPAEAYGPYDQRYLRGRNELWTESVFAPRVTVACYVPPGADGEEVSFRVQELAHVYVPMGTLMRLTESPVADAASTNAAQDGGSESLPRVYSDSPGASGEPLGALEEPLGCHNDVSCYPAWEGQARAVAGLGQVGVAGVVWCSGALLNDMDNETYTPYFMTANHCLSGNSTVLATQADADILEFYWFYQTEQCNGTLPDPERVPRTGGGADLISAQTRLDGSEHAFLRLWEAVPDGVGYVGWTTAPPAAGETLTSIHHPVYSHKRISFGTYGAAEDPDWFLRVNYSDGTTEPGSSGCPGFDSEGLFIGQLRGGPTPAYCPPDPGAFGEYGRFSVTYPQIRRWMEMGGTISVDGGYGGAEEGTPTKPFNTVGEANAFAWDGVRIKIGAGSYPETLTLSKEVTLLSTGGTVTIGEVSR